MKRKTLAYLLILSLLLTVGTVCACAAEEAEEDAEAESTLSDDIYSFQLELNGELYTFPMSYADFTALGWEYDGDETETMAPYGYTAAETFSKDGLEVYATLFNMGVNTVTYAECSVGGINVDQYQYEDAPDTQITMPGGIAYGVSTLEDIQAAYGTPSDTYEGDLYTSVTYEYDYYRDWEFYVFNESGVLEEFEVRNFLADEEANAAALAAVSDEPTEAALAYEAPAELGDDPMSFAVEFAGDLYQLPAPVSAFIANGWTLKEDQSDMAVAGEDYGWVTLMKDNQEMDCTAQNYDPNATVIQNCFITDVEADKFGPDVSITVPGGATMGMTEAELTAWLEEMELDYEKEDSSDSFHYYNVEGPESSLDGLQFVVNMEQDAVTSISVSYDPDTIG